MSTFINMSIMEDPPLLNQKYYAEFPPTVDDKEVFRLSIASQSTTTTTSLSTSSQRLSMASSNNDEEVAYCPPSNTTVASPPSSRYLISSYPTSASLRNKVLSRLYPSFQLASSDRHKKSLSDPFTATVMPPLSSLHEGTESTTVNTPIDPWCMSVKMAMENCIISDWLHKYEQPTFAFSRSWKRRLFILVDRIVFNFKSSKSTTPAKEHFILTNDTFVFVTEEFKKGFIIELRKPLLKWYIRCESVTQMRHWLESMKKIVACIKIGYDGLLDSTILASIQLTDDYRILIPSKTAYPNRRQQFRQSLPAPNERKYSIQQTKRQQRLSLADIPDWESILPPQLPPPKSRPPPVPQFYSSSSSTTINTTNSNNNLPTVSEDF